MYHNLFTNKQDIAKQFEVPEETLADLNIHYAFYDYADYSGDALVIFTGPDGKLYEVNSGHCSCMGLEGTWSPEETTWEAIGSRLDSLTDKYPGIEKAIFSGLFECEVLQ